MSQLLDHLKKTPNSTNRPQIAVLCKTDGMRAALEIELAAKYCVTTFPNSEHNLKQLTQGCWDVLVLDDVEIFKHIHAFLAGAYLPIMMLSATDDKEPMLQALEAGVSDYLKWPADKDILHARLRLLVSNKQCFDAQRQAMDQLKSSGARKDRFLHIVTHDLKNPLNSIKLAHYLMRMSLADNAEMAEPLHSIETAISSMNDLIMDFLESSSLENGKTQLDLEAITMEDAIWEAIFRHGPSANAKNITLLMGETKGVALADSKRLAQIMTNLVSNAIKYSPHNRFVTIASSVKENYVHVSVSDEGAGIPEDERSMLFEAFGRTSIQPTDGESSTGLGLWIVKELVTLHGGRLGYEAPASGGSIFWFELPVYVSLTEALAG